MINKHRLGVSEINLVTRNLKIKISPSSNIKDAWHEINEIYGLDEISFDESSGVLKLAYDASRVNLDEIEAVLLKYSVDISHDWWTTFKEDYYKFVDQNIKDNAKHDPWSCHQKSPRK